MTPTKEEPVPEEPERKTLVRGADGVLYVLTDENLAPFKMPEGEAERVTLILEVAHMDPVADKLSPKLIRLMEFAKCVGTHPPSEVYINTIKTVREEN